MHNWDTIKEIMHRTKVITNINLSNIGYHDNARLLILNYHVSRLLKKDLD